ncbi:MAG: BON domain-containing protein [Bdellovibrionales bacterium]|nr:BON domain-containing protein [Bdellovibrionales bacterium]
MQRSLLKIFKNIGSVTMISLLFAATCFAATNEEQSDTWLEAKLVTTITLNRNLSIFDIDTDVRNQVAYLSGVVATDVEKNLAEEVARSIDGIKDVNNKIAVDKSKAPRQEDMANNERSFGQKIEDLTTTASIKSSFLTNSNVDGLDINVDTMNGKVTLKGTVASDQEKALAVQIAKNTDGVSSVNDELKVVADNRKS